MWYASVYICVGLSYCFWQARNFVSVDVEICVSFVFYFCLYLCWSLVLFLPIFEWEQTGDFVSVDVCICVLFLFIFVLISCVGSANIWVGANRGFCVGKSRDVRKDSPITLSSCCFQHNIKTTETDKRIFQFQTFQQRKGKYGIFISKKPKF